MNASVRNAVFAPAFFGTPFALFVTAALAFASRLKVAAAAFSAAGLLYLFGGMILTMAINVPMNEALVMIDVPEQADQAWRIWQDYSVPWQFWNTVRAIVSAATLVLTGIAIVAMNKKRPDRSSGPIVPA